MAARNDPDGFGWVTRVLHWVMAFLVLMTLPLGLWIANMEVSLASLKYFGYHKSLGVTLLVLILIRLTWHRISPPPRPMSHGLVWQDRLARTVHLSFYVLLLAMPISGWIASSATGIDTVIFNRWTLPAIAPASETWETLGFALHGILGRLLILCIILHVSGALYRALVAKDGSLNRMLTGKP
mgnify:FL=1